MMVNVIIDHNYSNKDVSTRSRCVGWDVTPYYHQDMSIL